MPPREQVYGAATLLLTAVSFLTSIPQSIEKIQCGKDSGSALTTEVLARVAVIIFLASAILVLVGAALAGGGDYVFGWSPEDTGTAGAIGLAVAGFVIFVAIVVTIVAYGFSLDCLQT